MQDNSAPLEDGADPFADLRGSGPDEYPYMQVWNKRLKGTVTVGKWFVATASKRPMRDVYRREKRAAEQRLTRAPVDSERVIVSVVEILLARMIADVLEGRAETGTLQAVLIIGLTHREDARKAVQRVAKLFDEEV